MIVPMRTTFMEPNSKNNVSESDDRKHKPYQKIDEVTKKNYMKWKLKVTNVY
jgi:hypothetical protein